MHLIKFLHTAVGQSQNLDNLFDMVRELNNSILNSQVDRLESVKLLHDLVAQQSQSLATVQPAMVNQTINWFPFCRALDSRYHAELAASANKELCCLLIGMQPSRQEEWTKIWALKGFAQINGYVNTGRQIRAKLFPTASTSNAPPSSFSIAPVQSSTKNGR